MDNKSINSTNSHYLNSNPKWFRPRASKFSKCSDRCKCMAWHLLLTSSLHCSKFYSIIATYLMAATLAATLCKCLHTINRTKCLHSKCSMVACHHLIYIQLSHRCQLWTIPANIYHSRWQPSHQAPPINTTSNTHQTTYKVRTTFSRISLSIRQQMRQN